ncbi:hypothetical protein [Variovorax sp. YR566]|uniref:hypothetical protein n=1 Tax=Variovorax sp. YR566 TaxID=3450237 RepID=UPI003F812FA8
MPNYTGKILQYKNSVFTNSGQSDVEDFGVKLVLAFDAITKAIAKAPTKGKQFRVIYGFHGDNNGICCDPFSPEDLSAAEGIKKLYPGASFILTDGANQSTTDYGKLIDDGWVLFTWCDSDRYLHNKYQGRLKEKGLTNPKDLT